MKFTGVDAVVFDTDDFESSKRFLTDWGLTDSGSTTQQLLFITRDEAEVFVRHAGDPRSNGAQSPSPDLRGVVWGVESDADLQELEKRLGADGYRNEEGYLTIRDLDGFTHSFRISQVKPVLAAGQDVNAKGVVRRVDRRSPVYKQAKPVGIGHVVFWVNDIDAAANFLKEKLGFVERDRFIGFGIFLGACTPGPHHHIFLQSRPGKPGGAHVAFTVDNMLEVLGGGLNMDRLGWNTLLGPGFHPISSAFFWYFNSPLGPEIEYFTDDDWCTENWKPEAFKLSSEFYTDWAVTGFHKQPQGRH
jgi:catechol 2,3-dioxygenase-like lactoylglutathione lyase family enzyme